MFRLLAASRSTAVVALRSSTPSVRITQRLPRRAQPAHVAFTTRFNSSSAKEWDAPKLTYEQVKPKTEQPSPDKYLIDVREREEVELGSIPSSVNIPLSTLGADLHLNPVEFKAKHGFEKPKKDQEIVFYCRSGKRSASAADVAKRNGYTNLYNYEGSWLDWTAKEQGKKS